MPVPRKRSCAQCRRSKSRCSLTAPTCSRCSSRSLQCDYSAALHNPRTSGLAANSWEGVVLQDVSGSEDGLLEPAGGSDVLGQQFSELDMNFLGVEDMSAMQWNGDFEPSSHRQVSRKSQFAFVGGDTVLDASHTFAQSMEQSSASLFENSNSSAFDAHETRSHRQSSFQLREDAPQETYLTELSRKLFMSDFHAPPWPSPKSLPLKMRNLLSRKPTQNTSATLTANFLFSTVQSYPEMLSTSTFPPFIHQYSASLNSDLPEPLANCMTFMVMFRSKTPASEKFVYKTLFTEAQRLHNEAGLASTWPVFQC